MDFKSKKEIIEHVRVIMKNNNNNVFLNDMDSNFMFDLLQWHEEFDEKSGVGIDKFFIMDNEQYTNTRTFRILRFDGSTTHFSFMACLNNKTKKHRVIKAFRYHIESQIKDFKTEFFNNNSLVFCEFTKERLYSYACHVDHIKPKTFKKLMSDFMQNESLSFDNIDLLDSKDKYNEEFKNKELINKWFDYHKNNAELRVVSAKANLTILR